MANTALEGVRNRYGDFHVYWWAEAHVARLRDQDNKQKTPSFFAGGLKVHLKLASCRSQDGRSLLLLLRLLLLRLLLLRRLRLLRFLLRLRSFLRPGVLSKHWHGQREGQGSGEQQSEQLLHELRPP